MNSNIKNLLASSLLLLLPLATGCGKAGNPMAPKVEPAAAESLDVKVTLVRFVAVVDGDGIEGPGDFDFRAVVYDGAPTTLDVYGLIHVESGDTYSIDRSRTIRIAKDDSYRIDVMFACSELDGDILGRTWNDTRMDNLSDHRMHSNGSPTAGFGGVHSITLGGGELEVRLDYKITTTPV
jgi:hypothetical protein